MAEVKFSVRIGRRARNDAFDSRVAAFKGKVKDIDTFRANAAQMIGIVVKNSATGLIEEKLRVQIPKVQEDIRADLEKYARSALKFFFSRRSSTGGQDLVISLSNIMPTAGSGFGSKFARSQGKNEGVLYWAPLAQSTLQRKRARGQDPTLYFVGTGQLQSDMQTQLPKFFQRVLDPAVVVTFGKPRQDPPIRGVAQPIVRVAEIELVVATANRAGLAGISFMRGQLSDLTRDADGRLRNALTKNTLLRGFLEDQMDVMANDIVRKLENRRRTKLTGGRAFRFKKSTRGKIKGRAGSFKRLRGGIAAPVTREENERTQRPWVEASMSFWVINRLPAIFSNSMRKRIKRSG